MSDIPLIPLIKGNGMSEQRGDAARERGSKGGTARKVRRRVTNTKSNGRRRAPAPFFSCIKGSVTSERGGAAR